MRESYGIGWVLTMSLYDMLAADIQTIRGDVPTVLTWGADSVTGVASAVRMVEPVSGDGAMAESLLSWTGATGDFTTALPGVGSTVAVGAVRYHVAEKIPIGGGVSQFMLRRIAERPGRR